MDRYAARQLEKKKLADEAARKALEAVEKPLHERLNRHEKDALNAVFGLPDPPKQVFALGKDRCAAVWWPYVPPEVVPPKIEEPVEESKQVEPEVSIDPETPVQPVEPLDPDLIPSPREVVNPNIVLSWQVHRYRKDRSVPNGEWQYKGYTVFSNLAKTQVIVDDLTNDYEYRFEVKGTNAKGTGSESRPSNPVMVEAPLPSGWFRFYDSEARRHYYANLKLNRSRWSRPELDPYFLDEQILFNFEQNEINTLFKLFSEDMAHYKAISVSSFLDILREVGERCSRRWIVKLFRGYAKNEEELTSWVHFMEIINHIKRHRIKSAALISNPLTSFFLLFSRTKVKAMMKPKNFKMGDWRIEYSEVASRYYYKNSVTNESHWSMPPQVKFYIPPKLEDKLLKAFDYGQIEEFQQYFSLLDVDNSGDLSDKEIKLLLSALGINLPELKFQRLIKTVDLNGNGTIEFDEFCWMMFEIYRKDKLAFFRDIEPKAGPVKKKKDVLGQEVDEVNLADNSYHSAVGPTIYNDKMFAGKMNFNTMKYTILNFKSNNSSSGSRLAGAFRSVRGLARAISIRGNGNLIDTSEGGAGGGRGRRLSVGSVDSMNSAANYPVARPSLMKQMSSMFFRSDQDEAEARRNSKLNQMLSRFDDSKLVDSSLGAGKKRKSLTFASNSYEAALMNAKSAADKAAAANDRYNLEWEEELERIREEEEWERQQEGKSSRDFGEFGYAGGSPKSEKKPGSPSARVREDPMLPSAAAAAAVAAAAARPASPDEAPLPKQFNAHMNALSPSKLTSLEYKLAKLNPPPLKPVTVTALAAAAVKKAIVPPDYPPPDCDHDTLRLYVKAKRHKSSARLSMKLDGLQANSSFSSKKGAEKGAEKGEEEREEGAAGERPKSRESFVSQGSRKGSMRGSPKNGSRPESPSRGGSKPESPSNRASRQSSVRMIGSPETGSRKGTLSRQGSSRSVSGPPSRANSMRRSSSKKSVTDENDDSDKEDQEDSSKRKRPGSFLRQLSAKILPWGGDGSEYDSDSSYDSGGVKKKPHPKHCMCGCRSY